MSYKHTLDVQSIFTPFLQDGWTALFYATHNGHADLVRLLCEVYGADVLHRNKVRAVHTTSVIGCLGQLKCVCACVRVCVCVCVHVCVMCVYMCVWHACMPQSCSSSSSRLMAVYAWCVAVCCM